MSVSCRQLLKYIIYIILHCKDHKVRKASALGYFAVFAPFAVRYLAEKIKQDLKGAVHTGKKKYELGIENRYELKGGAVKVTLKQDDNILTERTLGCCIA